MHATDLGAAIEALDARYPGFKDRLLDEKGELRQFVNVYLNDEDVRLGHGLKARGAETTEPKSEEGSPRFAAFKDSEGNWLGLQELA